MAIISATLIFWLAGSGAKLVSGELADVIIAYGRLAGLILMLCILAQVLLASRMPLLDWFDGVTPLVAHRWLGFSIIGVIAAHVGLLVTGYAVREEVSIAEQFFTFVTQWEDILTASIAVFVILGIGIISIRRIRKLMTYEKWYAFHLFLYGAILLAFGHQLQTGDMAGEIARTFWIALLAAVFILFFLFRFVRPAWFFVRHRFYVTRVVPESASTTSIYIGGLGMSAFRFQAGQHAHVTFVQRGMSSHHPFSFSLPYNGSEVRFTVKKLGDFTGNIAAIMPGTPVIIDGPMGHLTLNMAKTGKYCFIAGGVGITPIASLIHALSDPHDAIALVSNRVSTDAPLLEEIAATGVQLHRYFSDEEPKKTIDICEIMRVCPDVRERDIFMCGPPGMMESLTRVLIAIGVPKEHIHVEGFGY